MNYFWQRFVVSVFHHCLCLYRIIWTCWPVSHTNIGHEYSLNWSQNLYMLEREQVHGHDPKIGYLLFNTWPDYIVLVLGQFWYSHTSKTMLTNFKLLLCLEIQKNLHLLFWEKNSFCICVHDTLCLRDVSIFWGRFIWTCTCSNLKLNFIWYLVTDPNLFFHTRSSPCTHVQVMFRVLWCEVSSSMQSMRYWI